MSVYMTEEEQLAAIKKWWNKYNNSITIVISLVLLTFIGIKYWNWHQDKIQMQASSAYERLMLAFSNQDSKGIQAYSNQLIKNYSKTIYADAAHLTLAKNYVSQDNYDKAQEHLEFVIKHSKLNALKQVARIRITRLMIAKKNYDQALTELASVNDNAYKPVIDELKGDIYAATGQYQQAIASYKEAITEVRTSGMGNLFLEMKTNELAALTQLQKNNATQAA